MKYLLLVLAVIGAGCGYHVGGRADLLPEKIQTIAIPAFRNETTRYRLTGRLPAALTREFISRTRYRIVADPGEADAVLNGSVVSVMSYPTVLDPDTGRATGVQMHVMLHISLIDRTTGEILFTQPNMEAKGRYEISVDERAYFEESDVALDRLSRDVARTVVAAVLEKF